jgi:lactoylglutathione lyase
VRIDHLALWTRDRDTLERLRVFYAEHFGARANALYESANRPGFASYFLTFPDGGPRLELMTAPGLSRRPTGEAAGYAHLALAAGSRAAVDALVARLAAAGVPAESGPRVTGDGYYEAVVRDPDGNVVEVTT